jgi:threonine synthase
MKGEGFVKGLRCRECSREYPHQPLFVCEWCFGPLEVVYDYEAIRRSLTRESLKRRPYNMYRYRELLPLSGDPIVGHNTGYTPLIRARNLERELGVKELYIKDDSVNHPTLSFKDRVVSVAISKAIEFGFDTVACASTGNLANSVAAQAAAANLKRVIFIPADLELGKVVGTLIYSPVLVGVDGNYDQVNRLCTEVASKYGWGFVNINLRPYYAEGSKTYGFEIAEQLDWRPPKHVIVPVAGGSLITKIWKAFKELEMLGLVEKVETRIYAAQAEGCCPVVEAIRENRDIIKPQKPKTIAKSLAIGNPADGVYAVRTALGSGGSGEAVSDEEIVDAIKLLAATEGIFTETAGGVTLGAARKLIENGVIPRDEPILVCITGNGLKTQEPLVERIGQFIRIEPNLSSFEEKVLKEVEG